VTRPLLEETVTALVESFAPPPGAALAVESATIDVPLEGRVELDRTGSPACRTRAGAADCCRLCTSRI